MRRPNLTLGAALLATFAWTGGASAQSGTVTAEELARHGFNVPSPNVMIVVISHTGSYERSASCEIHRADGAKKMQIGEIEAGETKAFGVDTVEGLVGTVWVHCIESGDGRRFSSNNFDAVGHTVVHFSTGSKFVIMQRIVP